MNEQLAGFAIWEAGGDYNDILLDAVRSKVFEGDCLSVFVVWQFIIYSTFV